MKNNNSKFTVKLPKHMHTLYQVESWVERLKSQRQLNADLIFIKEYSPSFKAMPQKWLVLGRLFDLGSDRPVIFYSAEGMKAAQMLIKFCEYKQSSFGGQIIRPRCTLLPPFIPHSAHFRTFSMDWWMSWFQARAHNGFWMQSSPTES